MVRAIKNIKGCESSLNSVFHRILDYNRGGFPSGPFFSFSFEKIFKINATF
jgi:hypothetical protein